MGNIFFCHDPICWAVQCRHPTLHPERKTPGKTKLLSRHSVRVQLHGHYIESLGLLFYGLVRYDLMQDCWKMNANDRPEFYKIASALEVNLSLQKCYLELQPDL